MGKVLLINLGFHIILTGEFTIYFVITVLTYSSELGDFRVAFCHMKISFIHIYTEQVNELIFIFCLGFARTHFETAVKGNRVLKVMTSQN